LSPQRAQKLEFEVMGPCSRFGRQNGFHKSASKSTPSLQPKHRVRF
jgi:hypothetical protein